MTCARQATCDTYTRPMRRCECYRASAVAKVMELLRAGHGPKQIANLSGLTLNAVKKTLERESKARGVSGYNQLLIRVTIESVLEKKVEAA